MSVTDEVQVLIIGGGIAGCSLAYRLAEAGCAEVMLLEKSELTSGSTWHAAGNVPLYMGGRLHEHASLLVGLHKHSLDFYRRFAEHSGRDVGFHACGSLKVATRQSELDSQISFSAFAEQEQIRFEVLDTAQVCEKFPYLNPDGIHSAAWTPDDGHIDPGALATALAEEAVELGAKLHRRQPVTAIERQADGRWLVHTPQRAVVASQLVNAAGLHAREISKLVGRGVPVVPMERQYLLTDTLPDIEDVEAELPVLRDASAPLYARQEGGSLLLGLYDNEPVFWSVDSTPASFDQELLPPDLERVDEALQKAMRRLPILHEVGVKRVINGPLLRTPDACPLVGPVADIPGYWLNTGYFAGVAQAGGCTGLLADWLLGRLPSADVSSINPSRFGADVDVHRTMALTRRAYSEELGRTVVDGTRM